MDLLHVKGRTKGEIVEHFEKVATDLMNNYFLRANDSIYRIVDLEFYYYAPGIFTDHYVQKDDLQAEMGRWFFHSGGIDVTFGQNGTYGSFLIRTVAKINVNDVDPLRDGIEKVFYGPLVVKKELCSNFKNAWEGDSNILKLEKHKGKVRKAKHILTSRRIGLNPNRNSEFFNTNLRYLMLSDHFIFNHKDKVNIIKHNVHKGRLSEEQGRILLGFKATT